jgi:hypothetical protein
MGVVPALPDVSLASRGQPSRMNAPAQDSDWRLTILFLLFLAALGVLMKFLTLLVPGRPTGSNRAFWITPLLSPSSLQRSRPLGELQSLFPRVLLIAIALVTCYVAFWKLVVPFDLPTALLGYVAMPVLVMMGPVMHFVVAMLWLPWGRLLPPLHDKPLLARTIAEFWGCRWNLWFSDWFRFVIFAPWRRRPVLALGLVFFISGVMHEWVVNLPFYLVTGKNLFGTMMLYFPLQAAGILIERRFLQGKPVASILFAWLIVFGPVPLLLNEGLLRVLHLWPGRG